MYEHYWHPKTRISQAQESRIIYWPHARTNRAGKSFYTRVVYDERIELALRYEFAEMVIQLNYLKRVRSQRQKSLRNANVMASKREFEGRGDFCLYRSAGGYDRCHGNRLLQQAFLSLPTVCRTFTADLPSKLKRLMKAAIGTVGNRPRCRVSRQVLFNAIDPTAS